MDEDEAELVGEVHDHVSTALELALEDSDDYVKATRRLIFALRTALEDAGADEPLAVIRHVLASEPE